MQLLDIVMINTYTKADALKRTRIIKQFLESKLFGLKQPLDLSPEDYAWFNSLDQSSFSSFDKQKLYQTITDVENNIKKIMPLTIYLPFELPPKELVKIGELLRKDYGKNFLVDIKFDPNLIGGCTLIWNNILRDYSLKKKIEDNQEVILNNLRQSLKR